MAIQLTEQQRQTVEAYQGRPVEVVDPVTQRTYVLIAAEAYQRVRDVLEGQEAPAQPAAAPPGPSPARPQPPGEGRPMRQRLKDLATPPEIAELVRKHTREMWLRKESRQVLEEELKLQYYFGGWYVGYLKTGEGKVVVAAGRLASEEFDRQLDALSPEERRKVVLYRPSIWSDRDSEILTPFSYED